ncbi:D-amino-acid dehydrogenase [Cribrihabitans marinus]|uniref:D-amino-acid dehydrogenase n=1 Tax=Cribrihabitans marinus TaxID=1227549 RepID=A0A1H7DYX3_9RHOB|nr:FAD-dependent oxidoreductase [Cribrihabitans marinus]SEK03505.1 D-amino-acid dehydrogenase [Cribrihabitans marinus]
MKDDANSPVVVIGAGIVGLSTAIWLARAGRPDTLIDRDGAGHDNAASYGNAGVLAACSVAPVTAPGLAAKGPGILLTPDFPVFLRWQYLPRLTTRQAGDAMLTRIWTSSSSSTLTVLPLFTI